MERIDKLLSSCGLGTRKEVKKLIKSGAVSVDGRLVSSSDEKVDEQNSAIFVNGVEVIYKKYI